MDNLSNCGTNGKGGVPPAVDEAGEIRLLALHFRPAAPTDGMSEDDAWHAVEQARDLAAIQENYLAERGIPRPTLAYTQTGAVLIVKLPGDVGRKLADAYAWAIEQAIKKHAKCFHNHNVRIEAVGLDEPLPVREWSRDWLVAVNAMHDAMDAEQEARYDALGYEDQDGDAELAQKLEEDHARKLAEAERAYHEARECAMEADEQKPWHASVRELIASGIVNLAGVWDDWTHGWWRDEIIRYTTDLPEPNMDDTEAEDDAWWKFASERFGEEFWEHMPVNPRWYEERAKKKEQIESWLDTAENGSWPAWRDAGRKPGPWVRRDEETGEKKQLDDRIKTLANLLPDDGVEQWGRFEWKLWSEIGRLAGLLPAGKEIHYYSHRAPLRDALPLNPLARKDWLQAKMDKEEARAAARPGQNTPAEQARRLATESTARELLRASLGREPTQEEVSQSASEMEAVKAFLKEEDAKEDAEKKELAVKFAGLDSAAFAVAEYRQEWLVKKLFVRNEPAAVGGPQKALKTMSMVDLAISLGSCSPFLGTFDVPNRVRVLFISGESGGAVVQRAARRICAAKNVKLAECAVNWSFTLPELSNPLHLKILADVVAHVKAEVVIYDPLYLGLLCGAGAKGKEASSIFDMGPLLRNAGKIIQDAGATPFLCHHANRKAEKNQPMELVDLSFAGLAEYAAQWFLLSRRERYDGQGCHRLWLNIGGRAGQSGLYHYDADEGRMDEGFGGLKWEVTVTPATLANANERSQRQQLRLNNQARQEQDDEAAVLLAIESLLRENDDMRRIGWVSARKLRDRAPNRMGKDKLARTLSRLVESGRVEERDDAEFPWNPGRPSAAVRVRHNGQADFFSNGSPGEAS
jgi:replicative DNA helicase